MKKAVEYVEGDKWVRLEPTMASRLAFSIVFNHPAIDSTSTRVGSISPVTPTYATSRARTFGFMQDVEFMQPTGWRSAAAWRMRS